MIIFDNAFSILHGVGLGLRHFDKVTQYIVVFDLEILQSRTRRIMGLQGSDDTACFVAQSPHLVEFDVKALGHKTTIAGQQWQIFTQGLLHMQGMGQWRLKQVAQK